MTVPHQGLRGMSSEDRQVLLVSGMLYPKRVSDIVDCWFELPEKTRGPGNLAMELLCHTILLLQQKKWGWPGLFKEGKRKYYYQWVVLMAHCKLVAEDAEQWNVTLSHQWSHRELKLQCDRVKIITTVT
eukprot:2933403-Rhodomonas_salina.1